MVPLKGSLVVRSPLDQGMSARLSSTLHRLKWLVAAGIRRDATWYDAPSVVGLAAHSALASPIRSAPLMDPRHSFSSEEKKGHPAMSNKHVLLSDADQLAHEPKHEASVAVLVHLKTLQ